jgi:hypothetical protein
MSMEMAPEMSGAHDGGWQSRPRPAFMAAKPQRYSTGVGDYSRQQAAERAGGSVDDLNPLVELGILTPTTGTGSQRATCVGSG